MTFNIVWTRAHLALLAFAAVAAIPALAAAQTAQPGTINQGGPMTIEQVEQHFAIAPEYKVTDLDGFTGQLLGAHGGVFVGKSFLIGAGFYTMLNGSEGQHGLTYGGAVVGWEPWNSGRFGVGLRSLVGWGRGTTSETVTLTTRERRGATLSTHQGLRGITTDLFIAEPQVNLLVGLTKHLHLDIGGGYRFAGAEHVDNDRFSGASGSIALRIGSAN